MFDSKTFNLMSTRLNKPLMQIQLQSLPINLLGNSCDYDSLKSICEQNDLLLLEDNCEPV